MEFHMCLCPSRRELMSTAYARHCRDWCTTRCTFPLLLLLRFPKQMCHLLSHFIICDYGLRNGVVCISCGEEGWLEQEGVIVLVVASSAWLQRRRQTRLLAD